MGARERLWWRSAQVLGLLLTAALLAGLLVRPEAALRILWYGVIPVLPAVFLVQPGLWRNVCPLATLNTLAGARTRGLVLHPRAARWTVPAGIALLALLVPARRFFFNVDGAALATAIVAVAVLALASGFVFERKAGFCNAICPVLPVERLYGQRPLARVGTAHCRSCTRCTPRGCLDLSPEKSVPQLLGSARRSARWLVTPYGAFAAAFPGFVLAYSLIPDTVPAEAARVYLGIGAGAAGSYAVIAVLVALVRIPAAVALPGLGVLALGIYYWYGAASIVSAWRLPAAAVHGIRAAAALRLAVWLLARVRSRGSAAGGQAVS
jgi:hypothetical protein